MSGEYLGSDDDDFDGRKYPDDPQAIMYRQCLACTQAAFPSMSFSLVKQDWYVGDSKLPTGSQPIAGFYSSVPKFRWKRLDKFRGRVACCFENHDGIRLLCCFTYM
jgi:hypothetical protein